MKRSEMINKIQYELNCLNLDKYSDITIAKLVLEIVEKNGMLPPAIPKLDTERFSVNGVEFYGQIININQWEEE